MRFISMSLCFALALGCGEDDHSVIDLGSRDPVSPGSGSPAEPGAPGASPDGEGAAGDGSAMTPQRSISACRAASGEACAAEPPGSNAAATDGTLPPNDGAGSSSSGGGGPDTGTGGSSALAGNAGSQGAASSGAGEPNGGSAAAGGAAPGEPESLPDLILDGAYLMSTIQQDFVDASADLCLFNEGCVTGDGVRRVVRFGTRSANVGSADVVVGEPVAGNPLWEFDACHQHFHFEGYARYDLVDASTGTVLPIGNKNGFCLQDLDSWSNPSCSTYDCTFQGISAGCADVYTPDLDCQWIDITDVAPGRYELVVTVNTDNVIRELRTDNNSASVTIEIAPSTVRMIP